LSFLLTRALSRYRELSADRAAAYLTGRPSSLSSALTKITGDMATIPTRDLRQAEPFNAFFFAPATSKKGFSMSQLIATHPPVQQRVAQLADISRQLGQGSCPTSVPPTRNRSTADEFLARSDGPLRAHQARPRCTLRTALGSDHLACCSRFSAHRQRIGGLSGIGRCRVRRS